MKMQKHVVALRGGVGNQLFGLAYGLRLRSEGQSVAFSFVDQFDREPELRHFLKSDEVVDLPKTFWRLLLKSRTRFSGVSQLFLTEDDIQSNKPRKSPIIFHWGYWQNREFPDSVKFDLKSYFLRRILSECPSFDAANSAVIHVRRGDYVTDPGAKLILGALPLSYFVNGARLLSDRGFSSFSVVTDDEVWVKSNLLHAIPGSRLSPGPRSWKTDLCSIANAGALVLSNSTFGWWGAFLGGTERAVVAPKDWFREPAVQPTLLYPNWDAVTAGRESP